MNPKHLLAPTPLAASAPAGAARPPDARAVFTRYEQAGVERVVGNDVLRIVYGRIHAFRFVPDVKDAPTATFFGTLGIGPKAGNQLS